MLAGRAFAVSIFGISFIANLQCFRSAQFGWILASVMMRRHIVTSVSYIFCKSSGVPVRGSMIRSLKRFWISGVAMALLISLLIRVTTFGGVLAGSTMPFQE